MSEALEKDLGRIEISKQGETSLMMTLRRSSSGLVVTVKAHPAVEAFMKGLGNGDSQSTHLSGPWWKLATRRDEGGKKDDSGKGYVYVYHMNVEVPRLPLESGDQVALNVPGGPLLIDDGTGRNKSIVNLSFLRLVGISEGAGITFFVKGVHSLEQLEKAHKLIGEGYKKFFRNYMLPVKMDIIVSTQAQSLPIAESEF